MDGFYIYIYILYINKLYIIVLTTLYAIAMDFPYVKPPEALQTSAASQASGSKGSRRRAALLECTDTQALVEQR